MRLGRRGAPWPKRFPWIVVQKFIRQCVCQRKARMARQGFYPANHMSHVPREGLFH